jgi:chloramphenicol 3-O-phosphotransferase
MLNGASSFGKSSIVKELQGVFDELFLNMGIDKFMGMVQPEYQGFGKKAESMWTWETVQDELAS